MHTQLTYERLQSAREAYSYPPVRLISAGADEPAEVEWPGIVRLRRAPFDLNGWKQGERRNGCTSVELDNFHKAHLLSESNAELLHGLASVQYWGNAWDPRGKPLSFDMARVKWLTNGKSKKGSRSSPQPASEIVRHIKETRSCVSAGNFAGALLACLNIQNIGMSFATKVIAFMDPENAGIYDRVIASFVKSSEAPGHLWCRASVSSTGSRTGKAYQAVAYALWCTWCRSRADGLKAAGRRWRDWDGSSHDWRAIDVEHAIFTIAKERG